MKEVYKCYGKGLPLTLDSLLQTIKSQWQTFSITNYSSACMLISPLRLIFNLWPPFWNKRYCPLPCLERAYRFPPTFEMTDSPALSDPNEKTYGKKHPGICKERFSTLNNFYHRREGGAIAVITDEPAGNVSSFV